MVKTLLFVFYLGLAANLFGQGVKPDKALIKIRAESDSGTCDVALQKLDKYCRKHDSTTATIEFIRAKCLYQLQRYEEAKTHMAAFFSLQKDTANEDYKYLTGISADLKVKASESFNGRDTTGLVGGGFNEQQTWDNAYRTNNIKAYRTYLRLFPNGAHVDDAKKVVEYYDTKENNPSRLIVDAVKRDDWKTIKELLEKGADINYAEVHKNSFDKPEGKVNEYYFETCLSVALLKFNYTMVKYFLEQGADPNRLVYRKVPEYDKKGGRTRSILENCIISTSKNGIYAGQDQKLIDFIDLMLHYGLDINFYQGSPIATAVYFHDPKHFKRTLLVRYMLRKGADPYMHGNSPQEKSAIQIARDRSDKSMLTLLKDKRYKEARKKQQAGKSAPAPLPKPKTATK